MQKQMTQWLIPVLLAIAAAGALWYYWIAVNKSPPEVVPPPQPVAEEPAELPGPLHPIAEIQVDQSDKPDLTPLPALEESDEYFKLELVGIFGDLMGELLAESGAIEKVVATVDNLPRDHIAERIRPVGSIGGQFEIGGQDGSGGFSISQDNYRRYDELVALVTSADLNEIADMYKRFYPLFQSAYTELGYPDEYFNDRLVEVIDHLLQTPQPVGPVALVRPHVLYEYADPDLESLSSGQKLMLRMGNEHMARIKKMLEELRQLVTDI
jgi:hypothetical protein